MSLKGTQGFGSKNTGKDVLGIGNSKSVGTEE